MVIRQLKRHSDNDVPRSKFGLIDESSDDTSKVAEADVHCDADATFKTAADVVAIPCHAERDEWVDAC